MDGPSPALPAPLAEGRVAIVYPWEEGRVLKLSRDWVPPEWVSYEFKIASLVHQSGLPVPRPYHLIEQDGRPGIVYDRIEGPTMLDRIGTAPHRAAQFGRILGELQAMMHTRTGLTDLPDNHTRLRDRIESIKDTPEIYRRHALDALAGLPTGSALLHGDFHPGNVILTKNTPVMIDWPDASRGHPLGDVARTIVLIQMGGLPGNPVLRLLVSGLRSVFKRAYLRAYFKHSDQDRRDLSAWLYPVIFARFAEGIESERERSIQWLDRLSPHPTGE